MASHYPDCPYAAAGANMPELRGRACTDCGAILRPAYPETLRHATSLSAGPVDEVTSLTITHESPRKPTTRERWIDRLLFWRTPPKRYNTLEMHFPAVKFAQVDYKRDGDGVTTIVGNFSAYSNHPGPVSIIAIDDNTPSVNLKEFLRS